MKITFLGTGTSTGIPQIACSCRTCTSSDPKDHRLRVSVCIEINGERIIIDCGPDFRQQVLKQRIDKLNHILITHAHYDHVGGLDDVRPFGNVTIYAEQQVAKHIKRSMPYCFSKNPYPGVPKFKLRVIDENPFKINDTCIQPIRAMHANLPVLGFKIANMAYITDLKHIDEAWIEQLNDLDVLILNALRHKIHFSHLNFEEAIQLSQKINAKKTYFTHFSHDAGTHNDLLNFLPDHVYPAYDNLILEV